MDIYDVVIVGGGPAGVTAALRTRELGASVALVERGRLGGTCTNDGCVPTRVLAKAARLVRDSAQFADYGLDAPPPSVDFARLLARTQQVVYSIQEKKQLLAHFEDVGVMAFDGVGAARFADPHTVTFGDATIRGENIIICAGGHARRLGLPGGDLAYTHSDVWSMTQLPASVVIVGGGATGCQLASVLEAFGSQVTLLDIAPTILPGEDTDVSRLVGEVFERNGIRIITGIDSLTEIEAVGELRRVHYVKSGEPQQLDVEAVILSVGWPGNLESLNLEAAGVTTRGPYIQVDDTLRTSVPHIFAAGDITGRMMLVQSAGHQARVAAENAVLGASRIDENRLVPHGGFTAPEYGSVGMTEAQAKDRHIDYAVATVPYADLDRAVIDGRPTGFCKLIVSRESREVVGAHVVGEQAVEVIQMIAAGMAGHLRIEQFADVELAYPTFAAIVGLAARQLARELDQVMVAPQWHVLKQIRFAEWERREY